MKQRKNWSPCSQEPNFFALDYRIGWTLPSKFKPQVEDIKANEDYDDTEEFLECDH